MHKLALVLSLVLAVVGTALMFVYVKRFEEERSGGSPVQVLVAVRVIKRDSPLVEDMIAVREVPMAYVDSRAVKVAEKARVVGVRVVNTVQPGQVLTWTDVAVGGNDRRALSSLVQPGYRAVSIRARSDTTSFELIEPGDRVDLITTIGEGADQRADRTSVVFLQNIIVLAVGTDTGGEGAAQMPASASAHRSSEQVLTLSLKVGEAQKLALVMDKGRISVALRHPEDLRVTEGVPDLGSSEISDSKSRNSVGPLRKPGATASAPHASVF